MFLSSLIEESCTKEENNKAGCTLTFGGQCIFMPFSFLYSCIKLGNVYKLFRKYLTKFLGQTECITKTFLCGN